MLDDLARELDAAVAPDEPNEIPPDDLDLANRLLRRWHRLGADAARVNALCDAEVRRIEGWRVSKLAGMDQERSRLAGLLEGFMRAVKARSYGKTKSLQLPNGTLKLRAPSNRPQVEVYDVAAFRQWALDNAHPELLLPPKPRDPDKAALAALAVVLDPDASTDAAAAGPPVTSAGEVVPGVRLVLKHQDTFNIAPATEPVSDEL